MQNITPCEGGKWSTNSEERKKETSWVTSGNISWNVNNKDTCRKLILTIVEVSLLVHHECLDFRAVILAEGEGSGVFWPELVFPGASKVDGVHKGQPCDAAEVLGWEQLRYLACRECFAWSVRIYTSVVCLGTACCRAAFEDTSEGEDGDLCNW